MKTKEKLTMDLIHAKAPQWMIDKAKAGQYDDYKSDSATPIVDLVNECNANGLGSMALKAIHGEYDSTKEESEEWFRKQGRLL